MMTPEQNGSNHAKIEMDARSRNESFARMAAAAFVAGLDPAVSELIDVKTAVSEAVTNAVIHGYENAGGVVYIDLLLEGAEFTVSVRDEGVGIEDVEKAREPMFTSKPDLERSGMGFCLMETFMDEVRVISQKGAGTEVIMKKTFSRP